LSDDEDDDLNGIRDYNTSQSDHKPSSYRCHLNGVTNQRHPSSGWHPDRNNYTAPHETLGDMDAYNAFLGFSSFLE